MQQFLIAISLLFTTYLVAQTSVVQKIAENTPTIKVTVPNALSDVGTIKFSIYTKDSFLKSEPLQSQSCTIKNGVGSVEFTNIPTGEYAIVCFHDENENGKMDFELNGMPKEHYGTSNNSLNNFGPPQFETSKFEVKNENLDIKIKF
jgi:uncharacterized protein (DUF2141 family)